MNRLYQAIENKLGDTLSPITWQTMQEDAVGNVGIFLYSGKDDDANLSGYTNECIKVHIQVNAGNEVERIAALNYLRTFVTRIETEQSDVDGVDFVHAQHQGARAHDIGKNQFGTHVCVSNIALKYTLD